MPGHLGVLLMAYGSPSGLEDVARYYAHLRAARGSPPPSQEEIEELTERYRRIGGRSPLLEMTIRQARALERELRARGRELKVYLGMRHSSPFIGEAVRRAREEGVSFLVAIALAPHYSRLSIGDYEQALREAAQGPTGLEYDMVRSYHLHPLFLEAWRERVEAALKPLEEGERRGLHTLFTAHSLPEAILRWGDPYPDQVLESARALAGLLELRSWEVAYQSAGATGGRWLGPHLLERVRALAREGRRTLLVVPLGFVSDHLEVLYDIDLEARGLAQSLNVKLLRPEMLNDSPTFIRALADLVEERLRARPR